MAAPIRSTFGPTDRRLRRALAALLFASLLGIPSVAAADWNIDPERIGAFGPSAGGGCATWTGTVEDLAQPQHRDPVLRESTRLAVIGHTDGQVSYDFLRWPELMDFDPDFVFNWIDDSIERHMQLTHEDALNTEQGQSLRRVLDYYAHMNRGDPPFMTVNGSPDLDETQMTDESELIHHPRGHVALYERCLSKGMVCEIDTQIINSGYSGDLTRFLIEQLER